jgi:molecular chaperone DnaK
LLAGIPINWSKEEPIDVTYSYNLNGILEVTAQCITNKKVENLTVHDALERDSQASFAQSMDKLQAFYQNASVEEEEDLEEDLEEDVSQEKLCEQLAVLLDRIAKIMPGSTALQQRNLKKLAQKMSQATLLTTTAEIQAIIAETTDFLIDLEIQE